MTVALRFLSLRQVSSVADGLDPSDVVRDFGVNARPVGAGTAVAVAGDTLQAPPSVQFLSKQVNFNI